MGYNRKDPSPESTDAALEGIGNLKGTAFSSICGKVLESSAIQL